MAFLNIFTNLIKFELASKGKVRIPGVATIKTVTKPGRGASIMVIFGKTLNVKAKPARTVVQIRILPTFRKQVTAKLAEQSPS